MAERKGPFCGAALRHGKAGTCRRAPGAGTDHLGAGNCSWHGGASPGGRAAAAEQRIEQEAERLLYQYDAAPVENPLTALQALAGRALALEQAIGDAVNHLSTIRYQAEGENGAGGEQLRAEVAVLERAMDRCGRLLVDIAKLNIEERLAKVTDLQIRLVTDALSAAFREMGLPPEQQKDARGRIARHLRAVS